MRIVVIGATSAIAEHCCRLWVQREACDLAQKGDSQGAMNRLLAAGALSGADYVNWQRATANDKLAESHWQQEQAYRVERAKVEDDFRQQMLTPENIRGYRDALRTGEIPAGTSLADYSRIIAGKPTMGALSSLFGEPGASPGAAQPQGAYGPRAAPGSAPAPSPAPAQAMPQASVPPVQQGPNADLPQNPAVTGQLPAQGRQDEEGRDEDGPAQGQAITPQTQTGAQVAQAVQPPQMTGPTNRFGIPDDQYQQAMAVAATDPDKALEIIARQPRNEGENRETLVTNKVRDDWQNLNKQFIVRRDAYQNIVTAAQDARDNPNARGPADIALVYGFMKMLDPNSVVRETEYATAANAGGVDPAVRNWWNKVLEGGQLPPEVREQMLRQAHKQYKAAYGTYLHARNDWRNIAVGQQVNPDLAVPDLTYGIIPDDAVLKDTSQRQALPDQLPAPLPRGPARPGYSRPIQQPSPAITNYLWKLFGG